MKSWILNSVVSSIAKTPFTYRSHIILFSRFPIRLYSWIISQGKVIMYLSLSSQSKKNCYFMKLFILDDLSLTEIDSTELTVYKESAPVFSSAKKLFWTLIIVWSSYSYHVVALVFEFILTLVVFWCSFVLSLLDRLMNVNSTELIHILQVISTSHIKNWYCQCRV